jgi:hypothetical protein
MYTAYILYIFPFSFFCGSTASVVWWTDILATDPEVLLSIPGAARFSEK